MVGLTRIELVTSSLSGTRSNQLSYKPTILRKRYGTDKSARFHLAPCAGLAACGAVSLERR